MVLYSVIIRTLHFTLCYKNNIFVLKLLILSISLYFRLIILLFNKIYQYKFVLCLIKF